MTLTAVLRDIDENLPQALDRLLDLMRIPSISTDPAFAPDCIRAAQWLVQELTDLGFDAALRPTAGHPMVVASGGETGPHLLFYGHYDVQPVDPIALWSRDPFDPVVEKDLSGDVMRDVIRGRGASDDKGQLMTFLEACRAWKAVHGTLPCRLTIFLEGEEESGSPSLIPFMKDNAEELRADLALICDTGLFQSKSPAIVTMLRGLLGEEITSLGRIKICIRACMVGSRSIRSAFCRAFWRGCMTIKVASPCPIFMTAWASCPKPSPRNGRHWPLTMRDSWGMWAYRCLQAR